MSSADNLIIEHQMIQIDGTHLWLGNSPDLRDIPTVLNCGVTAIIDLAIEEPLPNMPRTTTYCRFNLTDDGENLGKLTNCENNSPW